MHLKLDRDRLRNYDPDNRVQRYLFGAARYLWIDKVRRNRKLQLSDKLDEEAGPGANTIELADLEEQINRPLSQLPGLYRDVLGLSMQGR